MIKLTADESSALKSVLSAAGAPSISPEMEKKLIELGLVEKAAKGLKITSKGVAIANPAQMQASALGRRNSILQKNERPGNKQGRLK